MSHAPGTTVRKDPDASLVYTMDWSDWLVGDAEIDTSDWSITAPAGESVSVLTLDSEDDDGTSASVRLIGGTAGKTYKVTNRITTNETPAQTDDRSFMVAIRHQ